MKSYTGIPELKLYGSVTVGTKGQIVIPAEAREELQIREGDKLIVMNGRHRGLTVLKREAVEEMLEHAQASLGKLVDSIQEPQKRPDRPESQK